MEAFVRKLRQDFPSITFLPADTPSWSPRKRQITYPIQDSQANTWTLLHELGHALADHTTYESDVDLLYKEVEAWEQANILAKKYNARIDEEHIQNCLDTYRDWLHKRSTCPACETHGLQESRGRYSCFNCRTTWEVSAERFCRPYRLTRAQKA